MGVVINRERLKLELARRGWNGAELAQAAGLSRPTISAIMMGRPVTSRSVTLIAKALTKASVVDGVDVLLME